MQPKRKQTIGHKRKLNDIDNDEPASKRFKTTNKASPNAINIDKLKEELFNTYHTKFGWTFFKFWEFILSITKPNCNPLNTLNCLNLQLVGPFEYINGNLNTLSNDEILIHHRYYFDLPEFQTLIIELNNINNIHYGYWRDNPNYNPIGICQTTNNCDVIDKNIQLIHPIASNLFFFLLHIIENNTNSNNNKKQSEIQFINESLNKFININKININISNKLLSFKKREKRIVTKTFNGFGLVVPMENDVGYRDTQYSVNELKKIFKRMNNEKIKNKKVNAVEMECILTNICLADDEGDPGMGYEVGIDCFYSYNMFKNQAKRLLNNAYNLTNRNGFKIILNAHMNVRGTQNGVYNQLLNKKNNNKKKNENNDNKKKKNKKKKVKVNNEKQKITKFFQKKNVKKKVVKSSLDELSSDSD